MRQLRVTDFDVAATAKSADLIGASLGNVLFVVCPSEKRQFNLSSYSLKFLLFVPLSSMKVKQVYEKP